MNPVEKELLKAYLSPFEIEKDKIILEIKDHIKYYFDETPQCLYPIIEFINIKNSYFSQLVIMTRPRVYNKDVDVSLLAGKFIYDAYVAAQSILKDFKEQTDTLYTNLVNVVKKKLEDESTDNIEVIK